MLSNCSIVDGCTHTREAQRQTAHLAASPLPLHQQVEDSTKLMSAQNLVASPCQAAYLSCLLHGGHPKVQQGHVVDGTVAPVHERAFLTQQQLSGSASTEEMRGEGHMQPSKR